MNKKYLPLGSIVKIRLSQELFMIIGYLVIAKDGKVYDYYAIKYPFGFESRDTCVSFQSDYVKKVIFEGYSDSDFEKFNDMLNKVKSSDDIEFLDL